jgi:peroxiredoxin
MQMLNRMKWITAASLVIVAPVWAHCGHCGSDEKVQDADATSQEHSHAHAAIGSPAPDFKLTDADGKTHSLSDAKGKIVVLEWINHECPVVNRCHKANMMVDTLKKFEGKPVVWMAVDSSHFCAEKVESIKEWSKEQKLPYPILLDPAGEVGHVYGAKTTPHMYVIDQNGVLAYTGAISDDPYGQNDEAKNYVSDAVESLLSGSQVARATTKPFGCSVKYKK